MAISKRCKACKALSKLTAQECKCGKPLTHGTHTYRVAVKKPNGKWRTKTATTYDLAVRLEAKYKAETTEESEMGSAGRYAPIIDQVWEKYLKWAKANKRSWRDDQARWDSHVAGHLAGKRMNRIMPRDVEAILDDMRERGKPQKDSKKKPVPYAPATIKQVADLVKRVYNWAIKRNLYYGANPANNVELPKFDNTITNPLMRDDLSKLLNHLETWDNERASLFIRFALFTGRRRGEILNLKWKDVNLDKGLVTFAGTNTKNAESQTVPVSKICLDILERCWELKLSHWVFPSSTGAFYASFDSTWQRLKKRLALPYRFHDARHTFASYLASSGEVDIYTLQKLLSHKDIRMTMRYAHLFDSALKRGADVADKVFTF